MISVTVVASDEMSGGALAAALGAAPDIDRCELVVFPGTDVAFRDREADPNVIVYAAPIDADRIGALALRAPVLALGSGEAGEMVASVEAGAMGYLDSTSSFDDIGAAVRSLADGRATVDPALLGALLRHVVDRRRAERESLRTLDVLTPREDEVFRLLAKGHDNDEVGNLLFISPQTVRTHTRSIMSKLDLHSRSDLVSLAARCGLDLDPDQEEQM